ncbi:MAG TPA: electron transfer flavoprotein subunit alpha/FixB family protein [Acidimicrobiales bacterium]|nr:electron transfer flavoprotein subunit alpha/FixB family protein [Acidimicrobiales bacterium]
MATVALLSPQRAGLPASVALELATLARTLGDEVVAYAAGAGAADCAALLGEHGVSRLVVVELPEDEPPAPFLAAAIGEAARAGAYETLLLPATYDGRDVAARLSAALDLPVLANAVGLSREGEGIVAEHAVFGGNEIARARLTGEGPGLYLVRAKSVDAAPAGGRAAAVERATPARPASATVRIVSRQLEERSGPALEDAAVVVSGGRGLGAAERYALIEQLAALLGGAAGASRAVVDAGWAPYARQVGQTGKTVKPEVYLAFGISGATQHLVGMKGARHILAVNRDATAPIFSVAELGVVGDITDLLPKLIAALEARR